MVSYHNTLSGKRTISIGVPQGSVLGPLLFLIYVNDINRHVHLGACNLYADDTLVHCNGSTMSELKHNIQQCVSDIHEWYDQNKLVINKSKSSVMLATTRQRILHIDNNELDVHIGDYKLVQSDCIDYLGVTIDETISWNKHTDSICKQLVFIISSVSRLKHILPSHMLMLIYSSIIQPTFDYAMTIWGYTCANNQHNIQRIKNGPARVVTGNYDYVTIRCTELVRRLRWMCVTQRRDYFMSSLMYKSIHGMAPAYFCNETTLHSEIAERTTRSVNDNNVFVPYAHLESFKNSFTHRGPIVWNLLADYIKTCRTLHSFKAKMKLFTMN